MIVKIQSGLNSQEEWCLLEFQGEVLGDLPGNDLGQLIVKDDGKVEMDIGQHFLEGNVVKLKNPFIVVEKKTNPGTSIAESKGMEVVADTFEDNAIKSDLSIEGCIRKKIIFKTRPKPSGLKRMLK